jgi:hypothetical protein
VLVEVADVEPGARSEALVGGGSIIAAHAPHGPVDSNDEAVRGGLQLLSAAALDLSFPSSKRPFSITRLARPFH